MILTHLTNDDLARLSAIELHGKFKRVRCVLACWARGELNEPRLAKALGAFAPQDDGSPVKSTMLGMPAVNILREEP